MEPAPRADKCARFTRAGHASICGASSHPGAVELVVKDAGITPE